jgi:hypothetical protein
MVAPGVSSCDASDDQPTLDEILRQAEEKLLRLRRELCATERAAALVDLVFEDLVHGLQCEMERAISEVLLEALKDCQEERTCVVCLAAPKDSVLLPCTHMVHAHGHVCGVR